MANNTKDLKSNFASKITFKIIRPQLSVWGVTASLQFWCNRNNAWICWKKQKKKKLKQTTTTTIMITTTTAKTNENRIKKKMTETNRRKIDPKRKVSECCYICALFKTAALNFNFHYWQFFGVIPWQFCCCCCYFDAEKIKLQRKLNPVDAHKKLAQVKGSRFICCREIV